MSRPALEIARLAKSYGQQPALRDVSLTIEAGEIVALLGPNGAGKTTLVSIVGGLLRPDAGSVLVRGIDAVASSRQARLHLGIAPQELGVYPNLTVRRNLAFFGELAGLHRGSLAQRIEWVADAMRLEELMDRPARQLSGGQKRRLHTGMAMIHRPPLLLLDEPTAGVDVETRLALLEAVGKLAKEGTAICYSTHYLHEAEQLGGRAAIIDHGRIVADAEVTSLVDSAGDSVVEMRFDGPVPRKARPPKATDTAGAIRISTSAPASTIVQTLSELGSSAERLVGIEIIRPNLESVFLALTGHRVEAELGRELDVVSPA